MSEEFNPAECWMQHTITETTEDGERFHLNHSCMSSLSFGAEEMAWSTDDLGVAEEMLESVREKHNDSSSTFTLEEL